MNPAADDNSPVLTLGTQDSAALIKALAKKVNI